MLLKKVIQVLLAVLLLVAILTAPAASETSTLLVFPVVGKSSFEDTFGAPRSGGTRTHNGIDIAADKMTPVLAVVDGVVSWLNDGTSTSTANGLPYYNLLLHGDNGNDYYYIHLNNDTPGTDDGMGGPVYAYAPGIANGVRVEAGQHIAYVGDSGNAEETAPHLHFEIHAGGYKNPINPYQSLLAARERLFKDVDMSDWYFQYVNGLSSKNIVNGYKNGMFRSEGQVTRAEFIKMITTATGVATATAYSGLFSDVEPNHWAWTHIEAAKSMGLIDGDTRGRFRPDDPINRAEVAKIVVKVNKGRSTAENFSGIAFTDVAQDFWGFAPITVAKNSGIVSGYPDGTYRPFNVISRAEAAKIIYMLYKL